MYFKQIKNNAQKPTVQKEISKIAPPKILRAKNIANANITKQ